MKTGLICQYCRHGEIDISQSEANNDVILSCSHCDLVKRYNFKEINKPKEKKGTKPKNV